MQETSQKEKRQSNNAVILGNNLSKPKFKRDLMTNYIKNIIPILSCSKKYAI